jgi:hypothetical protein
MSSIKVFVSLTGCFAIGFGAALGFVGGLAAIDAIKELLRPKQNYKRPDKSAWFEQENAAEVNTAASSNPVQNSWSDAQGFDDASGSNTSMQKREIDMKVRMEVLHVH